MDQLPLLSHWATASQVETEAAEAAVAPISGSTTPDPAMTPVATRRLLVLGRGLRCRPVPEKSMAGSLSDACEVSCRVRAVR